MIIILYQCHGRFCDIPLRVMIGLRADDALCISDPCFHIAAFICPQQTVFLLQLQYTKYCRVDLLHQPAVLLRKESSAELSPDHTNEDMWHDYP